MCASQEKTSQYVSAKHFQLIGKNGIACAGRYHIIKNIDVLAFEVGFIKLNHLCLSDALFLVMAVLVYCQAVA